MQLSEICEMWAELEDLEITGGCNYLERCHDADFCGIDVQEAAWLALMNQDFLQHVHVVPIKPSLLTMPSTFLNLSPLLLVEPLY